MLLIRADDLVEAAEIIQSQLPNRNCIWINSMASRDLGHDVSLMVKDIRYLEQTGQQRDQTWAHAGDQEGVHRSQNIMGYQVWTKSRLDFLKCNSDES